MSGEVVGSVAHEHYGKYLPRGWIVECISFDQHIGPAQCSIWNPPVNPSDKVYADVEQNAYLTMYHKGQVEPPNELIVDDMPMHLTGYAYDKSADRTTADYFAGEYLGAQEVPYGVTA